jgi:hypothetical protein
MVLKVLLILFLVYFLVFRFFGMLLRPFMSARFQDPRQQQRYRDPFAAQQNQRREGEINIDHVPQKKSRKGKNFDGGEYVDFEEVD